MTNPANVDVQDIEDPSVRYITERFQAYLDQDADPALAVSLIQAEAQFAIAQRLEAIVHFMNTTIDPDLIASRFRQTIKILDNLRTADDEWKKRISEEAFEENLRRMRETTGREAGEVEEVVE
jgi:hypothetical protein